MRGRLTVSIWMSGRGETLGLVGESGSGKSTLGRILVGLMKPSAGELSFDGTQIADLDGAELRRFRRELQFIFQDPSGSLDPRMKVRDIVGEGLDAQGLERGARDRLITEMLDKVGLRREAAQRYPHELSGGQRQRVGSLVRLCFDRNSWSPTSRFPRSTFRSSLRC
jgi:ABC-type microcin C transport system duplicated ATPase subunit YejF